MSVIAQITREKQIPTRFVKRAALEAGEFVKNGKKVEQSTVIHIMTKNVEYVFTRENVKTAWAHTQTLY